ncbi:MAG: hypothetical protein AB7U73_12400 [Pirellulales bacterium]
MHEAVKQELNRLRREVAELASGDAPPLPDGRSGSVGAMRPPNVPPPRPSALVAPPLPGARADASSIDAPQLVPPPAAQPALFGASTISAPQPTAGAPALQSTAAAPSPSLRPSSLWSLGALVKLLVPQMPGWLTSVTVHAGLLVALALASVAASPGGLAETLSVVWSDTDAASDALVELPQLITLPDVDDPGALSADAARDPGAAALAGGAPEITATADTAAYLGESTGSGLGDEMAAALGNGRELPGVDEPSQGDADEEPLRGKGYASFCGLEAKGYRFVFIVDSSGSMQGPRFMAACHELLTSITDLDEHQSFYVIFFNATDYPQAWPHVDNEMSPAGLESTERVSHWMRGVIPNGWTNPDGAIRRGLDLKPDAIFLLTDGEFNQGSALSVIRRHKFRAAIHTVAFGSPAGSPMLQEIADRTGGTFRFVPE